jgi:hypothetical protein
MFKMVVIICLIPIALALAARWWFGVRVLALEGGRACRCDLKRWLPSPGDEAIVHRADQTARDFGRELRTKALAAWREQNPKAAASRENTRRFGLAVPPLSGVVAVFALLVGKIPVMGAIAIPVGATAIAALMGILTLPPELAAIHRAARKVREDRNFPSRDDEDAVIRCATAHAWDAALPPILRWLQR